MEKHRKLVRTVAALCVFFCGLGNASTTVAPPPPPVTQEMEDTQLGYLLTMPQTLQAGAQEQYCLTLQNVSSDVTITLALVEEEKDLEHEYTHTYVNGESQCNNFRVPKTPGTYEVSLIKDSDILTTSQVEVLGKNLITFVQSDKPIYKPGQIVKFRILTVKRNLRSRVGEIETVLIKDPNGFKVKQYKNVQSEGMANLEFQLISDAKLGAWLIEVTVDGEVTTQQFKVDEYVLPRFEVTIDPPSYFLVTSESFDGSVCAKYTYGKPVKGFLTLQVCPTGYGSYGEPCAIRQAEINGCHQFSINSSEILPTDRYFYGREFSLTASVREMDTGVQVNGTKQGPAVSYDPLKLKLVDYTNNYFKPGLSIHGKVLVSKPDGTPAVNETILVSAQDYNNGIYLAKMFETNEAGEIHYSICQGIRENTTSLSIRAEALNTASDEEVPYGRRLFKPSAYSNFRQWFSPSLSYIQIPALTDLQECGQTFTLNVPFTHNGLKPFIKFYYQVMSRGRIVHSGTTDAPTIPQPLNSVEVSVSSCLEVAEKSTPAPIFTPPSSSLVTSTLLPDLVNSNNTNSSEVNITFPEVKYESFEEESVENDADVKELEKEPLLEPERPLGIEPLSEEIARNPREKELRHKRSIMPRFGRGEEEEVVRSENPSDQVSEVTISFLITADMSPSFNLLLYYIRDDQETVADSMEFTVQPCFDNEVKMQFLDTTVRPGVETNIHLEAAAGSVCGIGVVDKSVNILGGDHQITPKKVFEKLAEYSLSSQGRYSYFMTDSKYCKKKFEEKDKKEEESEDEEYRYRDYWYRSNYVDAVEAFKQMGLLVLTNLELETRPCFKDFPVYYDSEPMPLGAVQLTSAGLPGPPRLADPINSVTDSNLHQLASDSVHLRTDFSETWLWDLLTVGESGALNISRKVPDTITQWVGNSLCVSSDAGFGLSPVTSLTTFQPFFLSFNLPYNAVRGERLPITITVYNYLEKCLHMLLKVDGKKGFKVHGGRVSKKPFCLCGGSSETKKIYITAQDIGSLPIFAQAEIVQGQCGNSVVMDTQYIGLTDAVERTILVKAEGVTQRYSHSVYICPKGQTVFKNNFTLPLPADMVPDSARGDVTVIGDIMGPALSNLDGLVRMPTGCGEQNMVGFTPNIYVLKYLTATRQLSEDLQDKTTNYMEIGYQRELKYRHSDGSFSAFGESGDKPGSTWLTAFVVKSFAQARPYIFIDKDDLKRSVEYLKQVQNPEEGPLLGCFFERGSVFSSYMQGGLGNNANEAALSAYVLIALLQAGLSTEDKVAVDAIRCMNQQMHLDIDIYTLSLVAYANTLYNASSPDTVVIMDLLRQNANTDGDLKYWKRKGEQPKPVNSWYYYSAPSAEVEMTAYALLATLNFYGEDAITQTQPIAFWLSNQQSAFGGYSSTQDTVLGLNALSEFAALSYSDEPTDLELITEVAGKTSFQKTFIVTDDNSLVLQRHPFNMNGDSDLFVSASGTGCALVQANVHFNKIPDKLGINDSVFILDVQPRLYQHNKNRCDRRTIRINFGQKSSDQFSTGMTILTVRMVTGWSIIPESMQELKSIYPILGIERAEENLKEGVINFYLDQLDTRTRHFTLDVEQVMTVPSAKDAEVQIYLYYEKDVTLIKTYKLKTTCGTKAELPYDQPWAPAADISQRRLPDGNSEARVRVSQLLDKNCPVCQTDGILEHFDDIVCNSTAVYKAHAGRNKTYSLKIKANLRPRQKQQLGGTFANVHMDEKCKCPLLEPPMKTVLIVTQAANLQNKTLEMDSTFVFNLSKHRGLEKKARQAQQHCPLD